MIFKRNQRSEILALRRCNVAGGGGEDEGGGDTRPRKRRRGDEFFPVELLGQVPASGIPYAAYGFRWSEEPEARAEAAQLPAAARPPVVRTSRGRTQVLPSRFNDSVLIDPWKKEKPVRPPVPVKTEPLVHKNGVRHDRVALSDRSFALSELDDDDEEEAMVARHPPQRNFGGSRYLASCSTLTSVHDEPYNKYHRKEVMLRHYYEEDDYRKEVMLRHYYEEDDEENEDDEEEDEEHEEEKEEIFHCTEKFVYGDIVWAKLGKRQPMWPGVVVDPTHEASAEAMPPQPHGVSVVCVMLFGWCTEFSDEKVHFCINCCIQTGFHFSLWVFRLFNYAFAGGMQKYVWVRQGLIFPFADYMEQ